MRNFKLKYHVENFLKLFFIQILFIHASFAAELFINPPKAPGVLVGQAEGSYIKSDIPVFDDLIGLVGNQLTIKGNVFGTGVFSGFGGIEEAEILVNATLTNDGDLRRGNIAIAGLADGVELVSGELKTLQYNVIGGLPGQIAENNVAVKITAEVTGKIEGPLEIIYVAAIEEVGRNFTNLFSESWASVLGVITATAMAGPNIPIDFDGDSILNPDDACKETIIGAIIDDQGCSQEQFCNNIKVESGPVSGLLSRRACMKADFKGDERFRLNPRDCKVEGKRDSLKCVAR